MNKYAQQFESNYEKDKSKDDTEEIMMNENGDYTIIHDNFKDGMI